MESTFERLKTILTSKYSVDPERITPEARLDSLGIDSLDMIEMLFEVEEEFSIAVPQDGGTIVTARVQDIVESIDKLVAEKNAAAEVRP